MNATNSMTDSHILVNGFAYAEPGTLDEALALLAEHGDAASVLAGGTDLLVQMKMERRAPQIVVSLRRISGLDAITNDADGLHIGALATIASVRRHPLVQAYYPALAEACASFSTTQVQMMGTLGGNLCNGSPASDSAPALIVYGAQAVLRSAAGERLVPVESFFRGPGKTALARRRGHGGGGVAGTPTPALPPRGGGSRKFVPLSFQGRGRHAAWRGWGSGWGRCGLPENLPRLGRYCEGERGGVAGARGRVCDRLPVGVWVGGACAGAEPPRRDSAGGPAVYPGVGCRGRAYCCG